MPNILITNHHKDYSGGGQYAKQLLLHLCKYYTLAADHDTNIEYYKSISDCHPDFSIKEVDSKFEPDIHLLISHRISLNPRGKVNFQLCYYPVEKDLRGWDFAVSFNEFVSAAAAERWGMPCLVVPIYFEGKFYPATSKEDTCICIGNYFFEPDGHSKNQHLIIDWFKKKCHLPRFKQTDSAWILH